jgi:probable rRNA maturation factor
MPTSRPPSCGPPTAAALEGGYALTDELEIEVLGPSRVPLEEIERLLSLALGSAGIDRGHVAVEFVSAERIAELNLAHRQTAGPTDVLSFPIDGTDPAAGPRELGDVVICPAHTEDLEKAVVHGVLHLCGYDHETDDGEMLALQRRVLDAL